MPETAQMELFQKTVEQRFEDWKATKGGRFALRDVYAIAAPYIAEAQRHGTKVSMKLIWELMRHKMRCFRARCQRKGIQVGKDNGYTLNNDFTALVARHIEAHRPDWAGVFEKRERGRKRGGPRLAWIVPAEERAAS